MARQPLVNWSHPIQNEPDFGSGEIIIHGQIEHMTKSYADTYDGTYFSIADLVATPIQQSQDITNIKILKEGMGLHEESDLFVGPEFGAQFPDYSHQQPEMGGLRMPTQLGWVRFTDGVRIGFRAFRAMIPRWRESEDEKAAPQASPTEDERLSCVQLIWELPDSALPETKETLTELRDYYHSLKNPSKYPTPPPRENVEAEVLSVE